MKKYKFYYEVIAHDIVNETTKRRLFALEGARIGKTR